MLTVSERHVRLNDGNDIAISGFISMGCTDSADHFYHVFHSTSIGFSGEQCSKPCWLMITGGYTTQYIGDDHRLLRWFLLNWDVLNNLVD